MWRDGCDCERRGTGAGSCEDWVGDGPCGRTVGTEVIPVVEYHGDGVVYVKDQSES